jgi:hypothetical protein
MSLNIRGLVVAAIGAALVFFSALAMVQAVSPYPDHLSDEQIGQTTYRTVPPSQDEALPPGCNILIPVPVASPRCSS